MKREKTQFNWPLIGNQHITEYLEKIIIKNQAGGTYIFNGPDNLGKTTTARYFAQSLLCQEKSRNEFKGPCDSCLSCRRFKAQGINEAQEEIGSPHSDFHLVKKEKNKKNISIEQVREFIKILSLSSFLNSYKIGIIKHAESLSQEASNALLKTLEEPREKVVVALITSELDNLPPTIISRAQVLNFYPVKSDIIYNYLINEKGISRSLAKNFSRLCLGRPALAIKFLENKEFFSNYEEKIRVFINFWTQDTNERFSSISELISARSGGQESTRQAKRIIEIWQGVVRDFILFEFGQNDLIQSSLIEEEILKIKNRSTLKNLLYLNQILRQAEENLNSNVNPKLVLENIAINI